ncbi:KPN_02809 family neutral zinc metallopeptidase [Actinophytocola sp.]|uniref:KPN_02809 family neutral zinc metallopeptidase n=1 Tax=Actinophytocola sp. TaxID=1872138 RepID=UPI002D2365E1|nr:neutral zinc metallopeptidase [Actinophytocola sp.]HYQ64566.1 neutral zinc metallopeptidase [Actinophytocola sp.]
MEFNDDAGLDTSQISDKRGIGGGIALGGGGLGVIGVIIYFVISQFSGGGGDASSGLGGFDLGQNEQVGASSLADRCRTGADANRDADCRAVAFINSIQGYWSGQLDGYQVAETNFFSGGVQTGCGNADSATGPFYCPADSEVYIDLTFFTELHDRFGAQGGPFVEGYVLAHEYGHHVQHLVGTSDKVGQSAGAESGSVRLELQADCYAGAWANHATTAPGASGKPLITQVTQDDVAAALDAAAHIGDDFIQKELGGGKVDTTQFTHGTSAQRQKWFSTGYRSGDPQQCDTFNTNDLG